MVSERAANVLVRFCATGPSSQLGFHVKRMKNIRNTKLISKLVFSELENCMYAQELFLNTSFVICLLQVLSLHT